MAVIETKNLIPIIGSDAVLLPDNLHYLAVKEMYGATHEIEVIYGTKAKMSNLGPNQSVCYGDGKSFHFRLTPLK